jgi:hypothetical protein
LVLGAAEAAIMDKEKKMDMDDSDGIFTVASEVSFG